MLPIKAPNINFQPKDNIIVNSDIYIIEKVTKKYLLISSHVKNLEYVKFYRPGTEILIGDNTSGWKYIPNKKRLEFHETLSSIVDGE